MLPEVTVYGGSAGSSGYSGYDAFSLMISSFGTAASHADIAATFLKLESSVGFALVSRAFGGVDILSNVYEMYNAGEMNTEDTLQILAAGALLIPGLNAGVVIVGGTALTVWELYEFILDHH